MPIHPVGRDYSQTLQEDRELAILADQLGIVDGLFVAMVDNMAKGRF